MMMLGYVLLAAGLLLMLYSLIRWGLRVVFADVAACALMTAGDLAGHRYMHAAWLAAITAALAWGWWRGGRGKRRRTARELGAKSRALVAGLVQRAREGARPRRRLIPVPGGAA
jgi:membrane protein implicated in regulation of membrane protease activity